MGKNAMLQRNRKPSHIRFDNVINISNDISAGYMNDIAPTDLSDSSHNRNKQQTNIVYFQFFSSITLLYISLRVNGIETTYSKQNKNKQKSKWLKKSKQNTHQSLRSYEPNLDSVSANSTTKSGRNWSWSCCWVLLKMLLVAEPKLVVMFVVVAEQKCRRNQNVISSQNCCLSWVLHDLTMKSLLLLQTMLESLSWNSVAAVTMAEVFGVKVMMEF